MRQGADAEAARRPQPDGPDPRAATGRTAGRPPASRPTGRPTVARPSPPSPDRAGAVGALRPPRSDAPTAFHQRIPEIRPRLCAYRGRTPEWDRHIRSGASTAKN